MRATNLAAVCQTITDRVLELLRQGTVPWCQPWRSTWPRNLFTKHEYHGINVLFLASAGFASPFWCTEGQIVKHKGRVKPSEYGRTVWVLLWHPGYRRSVELPHGVLCRRVPDFYKLYKVYNVEQTEGLERYVPANPTNRNTPVAAAEAIVAGMPLPPRVRFDSLGASYCVFTDEVRVPPLEHFVCAAEYHSTMFHELIHATGHPNRLKRISVELLAGFGSHLYSYEELVAEMGAAMLCGVAGISPLTVKNSASYIASWLEVLANNQRYVLYAAAQAQRAVHYVLNRPKRGAHGGARERGGEDASASNRQTSGFAQCAEPVGPRMAWAEGRTGGYFLRRSEPADRRHGCFGGRARPGTLAWPGAFSGHQPCAVSKVPAGR